jgi:hypothetical protein
MGSYPPPFWLVVNTEKKQNGILVNAEIMPIFIDGI